MDRVVDHPKTREGAGAGWVVYDVSCAPLRPVRYWVRPAPSSGSGPGPRVPQVAREDPGALRKVTPMTEVTQTAR